MTLMAGIPTGSIPVDEGRKVVVKYLTPNLKYFTARAVENVKQKPFICSYYRFGFIYSIANLIY